MPKGPKCVDKALELSSSVAMIMVDELEIIPTIHHCSVKHNNRASCIKCPTTRDPLNSGRCSQTKKNEKKAKEKTRGSFDVQNSTSIDVRDDMYKLQCD